MDQFKTTISLYCDPKIKSRLQHLLKEYNEWLEKKGKQTYSQTRAAEEAVQNWIEEKEEEMHGSIGMLLTGEKTK